jgi:hypothetical protein
LTDRPLCVAPAASNDGLISGMPPRIIPAFAVVPPMSNDSTFSMPSARPT